MQHKKKRRGLFFVTLILLLTFSFTVIPALVGQASTAEAYETATSFRYPLDPGGWFVGQRFGAWNTGRSAYHLAEDLLPNDYRTELPVYAPANGQVKFSGFQTGGYGYVVVIEHRLPDGSYVNSVLGHLRRAGLIPNGAEVSKGQRIGYLSANSLENGGYSFTHLHFGIRSGPFSTTRDPDGGWRYRGYTASPAIRDLWYHPSNFVAAHSRPAPDPAPVPVPEPPRQTGALTVTISPQGAVEAGARWRIVGTSAWQNSGRTLSQVPAGSYSVEFSDVTGWGKPANQTVTISSGQTAAVGASYAQQTPILYTNISSLNFGYVRQSRYATPQSYLLVGSNISLGVRIEAPTGFWISLNPSSGYQRVLTLPASGSGTINQRIYVAFLPTRTGIFNANITHQSPNISRNVNVRGLGY